MENKFELMLINKNTQKELEKLEECNNFLSKYNLALTQKDIKEIEIKRIDALKQNGRIELGNWIIDKIIKEFCVSPYIQQDNFLSTLYELIDMFYYYKNETKDIVSDDELIKFMRKCYDNVAHGDLEYLSGTILEKMKNNILNNRPIDYEIDIRKGEKN